MLVYQRVNDLIIGTVWTHPLLRPLPILKMVSVTVKQQQQQQQQQQEQEQEQQQQQHVFTTSQFASVTGSFHISD